MSLRDLFWSFSNFQFCILESACADVCSSNQSQYVHNVWKCATQYKACASLLFLFFPPPVQVEAVACGIGMEIYAGEWAVNTSIATEPRLPTQVFSHSSLTATGNYTHAKKLQTTCEMFPRETSGMSASL